MVNHAGSFKYLGDNTYIVSACTICKCVKVDDRHCVNCIGKNLTSIPQGIPPNTKRLDLSKNELKDLPASAFSELKHLDYLNLAYNKLSMLDANSFDGLSHLKILIIRNNSLSFSNGSESVPAKTFHPLFRLTRIDTRNNLWPKKKTEREYLNDMWMNLTNLEKIAMDGYPLVGLPQSFSNMAKLRYIGFNGGQCKIGRISYEYFAPLNTTSIRDLDMTRCGIYSFKANALRYLLNLTMFSIAYNPLSTSLINVAEGLFKFTNITHLYLNHTKMGTEIIKTILTRKIGQKGHQLKSLSLDDNEIHEMKTPLRVFPNLEVLSLAHNYIFFTSLPPDLLNLEHLTRLNICCMFTHPWNTEKESMNLTKSLLKDRHIGLNNTQSTGGHWFDCIDNGTCHITLPPKLFLIDMSYFGFLLPHIPNIVLHGNTSLKVLLTEVTRILSLKHTLLCPDNQEIPLAGIDLDGNAIYRVERLYFANCNFPNLHDVRFAINNMGEVIQKSGHRTFLGYFRFLRYLNLHKNHIDFIPNGMFANNSHMQNLLLGENFLQTFTEDIVHMHDLKLLDIGDNRITCFSPEMLNKFDVMFRQSNLTINLTGNPLQCTCQCKPFFDWLVNNTKHIYRFSHLSCTYSNGRNISLQYLTEITKRLQAECSDFSWLYGPAVFVVILILIETGFGIIYRFRYNTLYIWYKIRAKGKEERIKHITFKFDAFGAYNQEDYKFV